MKDSEGFWLLLAFTMLGMLFGIWVGTEINDYKQGQVDALTGNIKYELVTHADSTKTWEKIKGLEKK